MRVLVTGSAGKIGRRVVTRLAELGHRVFGTDIVAASYGPLFGQARYIRADLTDYGQAIAVVLRSHPDVVVHTAGIPEPRHDPAHVVFTNNTLSTYNVAEAAVGAKVPRLVYTSSETALGFVTAERPWAPDYLPVDEGHPLRPQDGYALSKALGEHILDAVVRRSDTTAVSVRPSLVLAPEDYGPLCEQIAANPRVGAFNHWSYSDAEDLAELIVLAALADTAGHEVVYGAQPDNLTGRPLAELIADVLGDAAPPLRALDRPDASGISSVKARALFGWKPERSWRDHLRPSRQ